MKDYDGYTPPRDMDFGQTLGSGIYGFNTKSQKEFAKGFRGGARIGFVVSVMIIVAVLLYVGIEWTI